MKKNLHIGFFFLIASILISIAVHYYSFNNLVWALYALSLNFIFLYIIVLLIYLSKKSKFLKRIFQ